MEGESELPFKTFRACLFAQAATAALAVRSRGDRNWFLRATMVERPTAKRLLGRKKTRNLPS